jgi:hypothetical protein
MYKGYLNKDTLVETFNNENENVDELCFALDVLFTGYELGDCITALATTLGRIPEDMEGVDKMLEYLKQALPYAHREHLRVTKELQKKGN